MAPTLTPADESRRQWLKRGTYQEVQTLFEVALQKRQEGKLDSAWDRLDRAICEYVWLYYCETTGKIRTGIRNPAILAKKMMSANQVDVWISGVLPRLLKRPHVVEPYQLDILEAAVKAICFPEEKANA